MKKLIIILLFFAPLTTFAAINYTRTPSNSITLNQINVSAHPDNLINDVCAGNAGIAYGWAIVGYRSGFNANEMFTTNRHLISDTSISEPLHLINGDPLPNGSTWVEIMTACYDQFNFENPNSVPDDGFSLIDVEGDGTNIVLTITNDFIQPIIDTTKISMIDTYRSLAPQIVLTIITIIVLYNLLNWLFKKIRNN